MRYATVLNEMEEDTFSRQDLLGALLRKYPDYNAGSFNRHLSKMISRGILESVGENMYITVSLGTARDVYVYDEPSTELSDVESFLNTEFPLADILVWETGQLNEFLDHLTAQSMVIVMVERMLMDAVFERMKERFTSVLFAPGPSDLRRYGGNGTIVINRLSSRYPKNSKHRHGYSIEKLAVDLFAERTMEAFVNADDRPTALEVAFRRYRVNETKLFNYARTRRVDAEIREAIGRANIKLHRGKGDTHNAKTK
ncbi:MAG: hypothetical protein FWD81_01725 [Methanomassiliicoccaceae archaeon]|nr:hypothetical protein [Methanomassiliicoccaceae archaeon]